MRRLDLFQRAVVGLLVALVAVAGFTFFKGDDSKAPAPVDTSLGRGPGTVRESALPTQAQQTIDRIEAGGPYPYSRDGIVFENREGLLPAQPRGFYHEYTVPTPGSSDRGARRMVAGSGGFYFYSPDHYRTFEQVVLETG